MYNMKKRCICDQQIALIYKYVTLQIHSTHVVNPSLVLECIQISPSWRMFPLYSIQTLLTTVEVVLFIVDCLGSSPRVSLLFRVEITISSSTSFLHSKRKRNLFSKNFKPINMYLVQQAYVGYLSCGTMLTGPHFQSNRRYVRTTYHNVSCFIRICHVQEWICCYRSHVVAIVTNNSCKTGLFDLSQLIWFEHCRIFVPKSIIKSKLLSCVPDYIYRLFYKYNY